MSYLDEVQPHLTGIREVVEKADTEKAALEQIINHQEGEITQLKQDLADCQAGTTPDPTPDPTPTRKVYYGSSNQESKGSWNDLIRHVGHDLMVHRTYDPSPVTAARSNMAEDLGKRASASSFKLGGGSGFDEWPKAIRGEWDDEVKARWNSVPLSHVLFDTPWHECDGGHDRQDGRSVDYTAMFDRFYFLLQPINQKRISEGGVPIKLGPILMGETVANLDPTIWTPDQMDFFGIDFYTQKTPPTPFKDRVPVYEKYAASQNVPLCIGETGCPQVDTRQGADKYTDVQKKAMRAGWVRDMWVYAKNNRAKYGYICYWNSSNNFMTSQPEWDALGSYI